MIFYRQLNIATSSIVGSRVSLNQTSDEDDDDDDFDDAISMVTGERKKYNIAQVNGMHLCSETTLILN